MRRSLLVAVTTAMIGSASPALAAATIVDQNGPDLNTRIYASQDSVLVAPNVGTTVYGNAGPANSAGHNTRFTGYATNDVSQIQAGTAATTVININDGGGFAQLNDNDFANNSSATQDLFGVLMDITAFDFSQYEFTVQLAGAGSVSVYYLLSGGDGTFIAADGNPLPTGNDANQFILGLGGLLPGQAFDAVLITSTGASIKQIKQNSVQAVPEPGTWAMILLGFGGIGLAMRRNQRRGRLLMQIA